MMTEKLQDDDVKLVEKLHVKYAALKRELAKVIVGQEDVIEQTLIAVFSRGHALLVASRALRRRSSSRRSRRCWTSASAASSSRPT